MATHTLLLVLTCLSMSHIRSSTAQDRLETGVICSHDTHNLMCEPGYVLQMTTVTHLRDNPNTCYDDSYPDNQFNINCDNSDAALAFMQNLCDGRPECVLTPNTISAPSDCGTLLYASAMYSCIPCPSGTFQNSHGCVACPLGHYQAVPGGSGSCLDKCPGRSTTLTPGGRSVEDCHPGFGIGPACPGETITLTCPLNWLIDDTAGFYGRADSMTCFSETNTARCTDTNFPGDIENLCNGKRVCTLNASLLTHSCTAADGNFYSYVTWICMPDSSLCPAGEVSTSGTKPCEKCEPGWFQDEVGQKTCKECEIGKYQPEAGENGCSECTFGQTTRKAGSTSLTSCYSPQSGNTDPHFMVTHPLSRERLCFDYSGTNQQIFRLIADEENGVFVNGEVFETAKDPSKSATYFSDFGIVSPTSNMTVHRKVITVNGVNMTWDMNNTYTSRDLRVSPGSDKWSFLVELLDQDISIVVRRTLSKKFGYFLGFYVVNVHGFSDDCDGIVGRFLNTDFEIYEDRSGNHSAFVDFSSKPVLVEVQLKERLNPTMHHSVDCWLYEAIDDEHNLLLGGSQEVPYLMSAGKM